MFKLYLCVNKWAGNFSEHCSTKYLYTVRHVYEEKYKKIKGVDSADFLPKQ